MGVGMLWTLTLLGAMRELLGSGTLLGGIDMVFPTLQPIQLLPESYPGFLLALLPPGAFILLGCMIAWKNWMDARAAEKARRNCRYRAKFSAATESDRLTPCVLPTSARRCWRWGPWIAISTASFAPGHRASRWTLVRAAKPVKTSFHFPCANVCLH